MIDLGCLQRLRSSYCLRAPFILTEDAKALRECHRRAALLSDRMEEDSTKAILEWQLSSQSNDDCWKTADLAAGLLHFGARISVSVKDHLEQSLEGKCHVCLTDSRPLNLLQTCREQLGEEEGLESLLSAVGHGAATTSDAATHHLCIVFDLAAAIMENTSNCRWPQGVVAHYGIGTSLRPLLSLATAAVARTGEDQLIFHSCRLLRVYHQLMLHDKMRPSTDEYHPTFHCITHDNRLRKSHSTTYNCSNSFLPSVSFLYDLANAARTIENSVEDGLANAALLCIQARRRWAVLGALAELLLDVLLSEETAVVPLTISAQIEDLVVLAFQSSELFLAERSLSKHDVSPTHSPALTDELQAKPKEDAKTEGSHHLSAGSYADEQDPVSSWREKHTAGSVSLEPVQKLPFHDTACSCDPSSSIEEVMWRGEISFFYDCLARDRCCWIQSVLLKLGLPDRLLELITEITTSNYDAGLLLTQTGSPLRNTSLCGLQHAEKQSSLDGSGQICEGHTDAAARNMVSTSEHTLNLPVTLTKPVLCHGGQPTWQRDLEERLQIRAQQEAGGSEEAVQTVLASNSSTTPDSNSTTSAVRSRVLPVRGGNGSPENSENVDKATQHLQHVVEISNLLSGPAERTPPEPIALAIVTAGYPLEGGSESAYRSHPEEICHVSPRHPVLVPRLNLGGLAPPIAGYGVAPLSALSDKSTMRSVIRTPPPAGPDAPQSPQLLSSARASFVMSPILKGVAQQKMRNFYPGRLSSLDHKSPSSEKTPLSCTSNLSPGTHEVHMSSGVVRQRTQGEGDSASSGAYLLQGEEENAADHGEQLSPAIIAGGPATTIGARYHTSCQMTDTKQLSHDLLLLVLLLQLLLPPQPDADEEELPVLQMMKDSPVWPLTMALLQDMPDCDVVGLLRLLNHSMRTDLVQAVQLLTSVRRQYGNQHSALDSSRVLRSGGTATIRADNFHKRVTKEIPLLMTGGGIPELACFETAWGEAAALLKCQPRPRLYMGDYFDLEEEISDLPGGCEKLVPRVLGVHLVRDEDIPTMPLELHIVMEKWSSDLAEWRRSEDARYSSGGGAVVEERDSCATVTEEGAERLMTLLDIFSKILVAVRLLHKRGIVHGDLKAQNVLVNRTDSALQVALCDFSDAAMEGGSHRAAHETRLTPAVLPPEVLMERTIQQTILLHGKSHGGTEEMLVMDPNQQSTSRDIWSLGCLLFELLTSEFLFPSEASQLTLIMKQGGPLVTEESCSLLDKVVARLLGSFSGQPTCSRISPASVSCVGKKVASEISCFCTNVLVRDPLKRPTLDKVVDMFDCLLSQVKKELIAIFPMKTDDTALPVSKTTDQRVDGHNRDICSPEHPTAADGSLKSRSSGLSESIRTASVHMDHPVAEAKAVATQQSHLIIADGLRRSNSVRIWRLFADLVIVIKEETDEELYDSQFSNCNEDVILDLLTEELWNIPCSTRGSSRMFAILDLCCYAFQPEALDAHCIAAIRQRIRRCLVDSDGFTGATVVLVCQSPVHIGPQCVDSHVRTHKASQTAQMGPISRPATDFLSANVCCSSNVIPMLVESIVGPSHFATLRTMFPTECLRDIRWDVHE